MIDWIDIKTQLPAYGDFIIVVGKVWGPAIGFRDTNNKFYVNGKELVEGAITHWQPIPERPTAKYFSGDMGHNTYVLKFGTNSIEFIREWENLDLVVFWLNKLIEKGILKVED